MSSIFDIEIVELDSERFRSDHPGYFSTVESVMNQRLDLVYCDHAAVLNWIDSAGWTA